MGSPGLFGSTDDEAQPLRGRRLQDSLAVAALLLTIASLIFTGGYNWHRVDELSKAMEKVDETYVRKDVLAGQFQTLNEQLAAMKIQLDDVKTTLREQRR